MKTSYRILALFGLLLVVAGGCGKAEKDEASEKETSAAKSDEVALLGKYDGKLPCADCSAIKTELRLYAHSRSALAERYELKETYLGAKGGDRVFNSTGKWVVLHGSPKNPNATIFQLHPEHGEVRNFLKVDEHSLRQLDRSEAEIKSKSNYTLKRVESGPAAGKTAVAKTGSAKTGNAKTEGAKTEGAKSAGTKAEVTKATAPSSGRSGVLTMIDNDTSRDLKRGDLVFVRLDANHSTGFSWAMADSTSDVIRRDGSPVYTRKVDDKGKLESGGSETWRFRAMNAGRQTVRLEYRRPWERNVPERTFRFIAIVH